jgi:phosphohistidine phosphatase
MRKLLLVRHAKSGRKNPELDDHERPLNRRGERDSITMSRFLMEQDETLDVIYSSTATRAIDFAQTLSEFCGFTFIPDLSFYTFNFDEFFEILRSLPDSAERIAIVGHNPAITQAVNFLSGSEIANIPTAGVVALRCEINNWDGLREDCAEIEYFESPKLLLKRQTF